MITNSHNLRYTLNKIKKCDQYWDDMSLDEKGRICAKCNKTIVDFSDKSIEEVSLLMLGTPGQVCGFYRPDQIKKIKGKSNRVTTVLTAGLLLGTASTLPARQKKGQVETLQKEQQLNIQAGNKEQSSPVILFEGKITDENGESLPGGIISIKGSGNGTVSDIDGKFQIGVSRNECRESITLQFNALGHAEMEQQFIIADLPAKTTLGPIKLVTKGEIIAYYVYQEAPLYKRIWFKMKRPFRKQK